MAGIRTVHVLVSQAVTAVRRSAELVVRHSAGRTASAITAYSTVRHTDGAGRGSQVVPRGAGTAGCSGTADTAVDFAESAGVCTGLPIPSFACGA